MKRCLKCGKIYEDKVEICKNDKNVLVLGPDPHIYGYFSQYLKNMKFEGEKQHSLGATTARLLLVLICAIGLLGGLIILA